MAGSGVHPYQCNGRANRNSLQERSLGRSEVLNFQEFLRNEEKALGLISYSASTRCLASVQVVMNQPLAMPSVDYSPDVRFCAEKVNGDATIA